MCRQLNARENLANPKIWQSSPRTGRGNYEINQKRIDYFWKGSLCYVDAHNLLRSCLCGGRYVSDGPIALMCFLKAWLALFDGRSMAIIEFLTHIQRDGLKKFVPISIRGDE
jgi:hypothetical protein